MIIPCFFYMNPKRNMPNYFISWHEKEKKCHENIIFGALIVYQSKGDLTAIDKLRLTFLVTCSTEPPVDIFSFSVHITGQLSHCHDDVPRKK